MEKSLKSTLKFTQCLAPVAVTDNVSSTGVATAEGGSLTFLVNVGAFAFSGDNKLNLIVQHADVDTDGSYAAAGDADIFDAEVGASGIARILDTTSEAGNVYAIHYKGTKKFARIRVTEEGTVSTVLSVTAVQGHLRANPS
jgi:hypothetical protein